MKPNEALDEAARLLAEIMRDEVNAQDEAEKWLRAYAPQYLTIGQAPIDSGLVSSNLPS